MAESSTPEGALEPVGACTETPELPERQGALRWRLLALAIAMTAVSCVGVSASRVRSDGTAELQRYCANGTKVAADGLLDDFEDADNRLAPADGRGGYWWKSADSAGSQIGPDDFKPVPGGIGGSLAMQAFGKTASGGGDDGWGAQFGANLTPSGTYDASKYVGLRFMARVGEASTSSVRFKISDVNTHPDLGVCKTCWNHFGRDINLSTEWQEYELMFASLEQAPYWGDPRPASITPEKLYSFDFQIGPGAQFDVWIDDMAFIECR